MKKRFFLIILILLVLPVLLTGCGKSSEKKDDIILNKIQILIIDDNKNELFNKEIETDKKYLIDVLREIDEIKLKTEDGQYGAYITSMMEIDQKNTKKGIYYWSYYVNEEYAQEGVSKHKIKDGEIYKFIYEFYES